MFPKGWIVIERGSGTMLMLAVIGASLAALGATQVAVSNLIGAARLQATVERAALTADDALRGLTTGYPCDLVKEVAGQNMANLVECRIVGFEAFVKLRVQGIGIVLNASARAGPSS